MRALSVSAYNRGCMWHVSAPHRPCIGHRTGYSLHENARIISGLASADFEGVFAYSYKRWRPRLFFGEPWRGQTRRNAIVRAVASASFTAPPTKGRRRASAVRLTSVAIAPRLAASRSCPGRNPATARLKSAIGSSALNTDASCVFANWLHRGPKVWTVSLIFLRRLRRWNPTEVIPKTVSLMRQTFPPF